MFYWLMPLSVAVSTFGTANGTIFAAGRLCYVASREGHLMNGLSFVHKDKLTPAPALLLNVSSNTNVVAFEIMRLSNYIKSGSKYEYHLIHFISIGTNSRNNGIDGRY